MDDRERPLLRKIKRRKKWSRHLNMNLTLGSKRQQTTRYKGGLLIWEIINGRNGVSTQTRNEPKCPGAKGTINEMMKERAMKRSNDAKKCWLLDRLMNGGKDEMHQKMLTLPVSNE